MDKRLEDQIDVCDDFSARVLSRTKQEPGATFIYHGAELRKTASAAKESSYKYRFAGWKRNTSTYCRR